MYVPPSFKIFSRVNCIPKRNAIVIRRIENEHGCTLSRIAAISTSGKSQAPPLLKFQMIDEVAELFFRITIPTIIKDIIPIVIIIFFIQLWSDYGFNFKFKFVAILVFKINKSINHTDSGWAMRIWVIDDFNISRFSRFDSFI